MYSVAAATASSALRLNVFHRTESVAMRVGPCRRLVRQPHNLDVPLSSMRPPLHSRSTSAAADSSWRACVLGDIPANQPFDLVNGFKDQVAEDRRIWFAEDDVARC